MGKNISLFNEILPNLQTFVLQYRSIVYILIQEPTLEGSIRIRGFLDRNPDLCFLSSIFSIVTATATTPPKSVKTFVK